MPGKTGADVVESLKDDEILCNIPIIVLSANEDTKSHFEDRNLSPNNFLVKPFDLRDLLEIINEYCDSPKED